MDSRSTIRIRLRANEPEILEFLFITRDFVTTLFMVIQENIGGFTKEVDTTADMI
jgi:hypothetical protein